MSQGLPILVRLRQSPLPVLARLHPSSTDPETKETADGLYRKWINRPVRRLQLRPCAGVVTRMRGSRVSDTYTSPEGSTSALHRVHRLL